VSDADGVCAEFGIGIGKDAAIGPEHAPNGDAQTGGERAHASLFSTLWHGVFGLRQ
jgi:hypothetical protein